MHRHQAKVLRHSVAALNLLRGPLLPTMLRLLIATIIGMCGLYHGLLANPQPPEDQPQGPALSPEDSSKQFHVPNDLRWEQLLTEPTITQPLMTSFDSHGRLWLVEYRQYPEPAGIKAVSRDNFWRIVYDRQPLPPGHGGVPGIDRISIHEDRDADGTLETHRIFLDGLNIATAVVPDAGGAWVLNPPYLLYYHDRDQDGKADGTPEVHLQGFGLEDTHSVVNNLCLGPDGWLYAAQGSTVTAKVRRPNLHQQPGTNPQRDTEFTNDSDATSVKSLGQLIWRYHPQTRQYEVFAEGGGNAFGVAFDSQGRLFSGHNGGDTRGFHYLQGAYYRKGFTKHGSLSNPYAFGFFEPMKHDAVQRFTHTMLLTDGTSLQDSNKSMITVDPLHGKLFRTDLLTRGPTFATQDRPDPVSSDDKWFRPVAIHTGPDGAAYVCDWYDFQVAHLYAHVGKMDREHGRVYRLSRNQPSLAPVWDGALANAADDAGLAYLHRCLDHPYRWQRWKAIELLAAHPLREQLAPVIAGEVGTHAYPLERLWLAHACGWLPDTIPFQTRSASLESRSHFAQIDWLAHPDPMVRAWWIRLIGDDQQLEPSQRDALVRRIAVETDLEVIAQSLCTAKRLPASDAILFITSWLSNPIAQSESVHDDLMLPLLTWWAIEHHADSRETLFAALLKEPTGWNLSFMERRIVPNLIQRWTMQGDEASRQSISDLLQSIESLPEPSRKVVGQNAIVGIDRALEGKTIRGLDPQLLKRLQALGEVPLSFRLRLDASNAVEEASRLLVDSKQPVALRLQIAKLANEIAHPALWPSLQEIARSKPQSDSDVTLRVAVLSSLKGFGEQAVAEFISDIWPDLEGEALIAASATLASRPQWTKNWLDLCRTGKCDVRKLPIEAQRAMRLHGQSDIDRELDRYFSPMSGLDLASAQKKSRQMAELILEGNGDPYVGKKIYKGMCGRCHKLFDQGGDVGPDLTGYQRDMLETLLQNTVAPNLEIREGYQSMSAITSDGEVIIGIVERQTETAMVLKGVDGQSHWLDKSDIESLKPQPQSLMPEGMLDSLSPQELRDLFGYLRSSQPLFDGT